MIEHRRTHREALWMAFKMSAMMMVSAVAVVALLLYALIHYDGTFTPRASEEMWHLYKLTVLLFLIVMLPLMTLGGWIQNRRERTRAEIEAEERAQAERLLKKYPDLKG